MSSAAGADAPSSVPEPAPPSAREIDPDQIPVASGEAPPDVRLPPEEYKRRVREELVLRKHERRTRAKRRRQAADDDALRRSLGYPVDSDEP